MFEIFFKKIIQELEDELSLIEKNYQNGKYKTQQEKDQCTLIYNTQKHQIIKVLKIIKDNYKEIKGEIKK